MGGRNAQSAYIQTCLVLLLLVKVLGVLDVAGVDDSGVWSTPQVLGCWGVVVRMQYIVSDDFGYIGYQTL